MHIVIPMYSRIIESLCMNGILQKIDKLISKLKICVYFSKQNCIKPRRIYVVEPLIRIINSKCDIRKTIVICMYNVHVSFSDKQFNNH